MIFLREIQSAMALANGVPTRFMRGRNRLRKVAYARQEAIYLAAVLTEHTTTVIGKRFGQDHSTILYAVKQVEGRMSQDEEIRQRIESAERLMRTEEFVAARRVGYWLNSLMLYEFGKIFELPREQRRPMGGAVRGADLSSAPSALILRRQV